MQISTKKDNQKFSDLIFQKYIETVNNSRILEPIEEDEPKSNELTKKLFHCKINAKKEFANCHNKIVELFNSIIKIENDINSDIEYLEKTNTSYRETWKNIFEEFNFQLSEIFSYANNKLIGSFENKVNKIDNFTICLFGRTKVGKSTTMEALTKGSGKTIGVGRQNTTIEITEYPWKGLKVIDTPGIDAMHKMNELEDLAVTFADTADLIVFLLPHQIEKGDFEKFSLFYKQNKPIIILLNVKAEIGKEGSKDLEMFLKNEAENLYEKEKINGYIERINGFIFNTLNIDKSLIPILPIHSQSAFLANQVKNEELSKQLYKISHFENFENALIKEVIEFGELYRIKNPYETVILFADNIKTKLTSFHSYLSEQKELFIEYIDKFSVVKTKIHSKRDKIIKNTISSYFSNKLRSVPEIVDELFQTKKEEKRKEKLKKFIKEKDIIRLMKKALNEINKDVKAKIIDFFESFAKDLTQLNIEQKKQSFHSSTNSKIEDIDNLKFKGNLIEGAGLVTGVLGSVGLAVVAIDGAILGAEGTLFGIGGANIWNPVGWALIGAGVILGIVGIFVTKKQKKKIAEAKTKAIKELKTAIRKTEKEVKNKVHKSINETIKDIEQKNINLMQKYVNYTDKHLNNITNLILNIETISKQSEQQKYQAMLNNILNDKSSIVKNVYQSDFDINIVLNSLPKCDTDITQILSRVEEKQVNLTNI